jgi:hypothetical protein
MKRHFAPAPFHWVDLEMRIRPYARALRVLSVAPLARGVSLVAQQHLLRVVRAHDRLRERARAQARRVVRVRVREQVQRRGGHARAAAERVHADRVRAHEAVVGRPGGHYAMEKLCTQEEEEGRSVAFKLRREEHVRPSLLARRHLDVAILLLSSP